MHQSWIPKALHSAWTWHTETRLVIPRLGCIQAQVLRSHFGSWGKRQEEKCLGMLLPHRDLKLGFKCIWHYSGDLKCKTKRVTLPLQPELLFQPFCLMKYLCHCKQKPLCVTCAWIYWHTYISAGSSSRVNDIHSHITSIERIQCIIASNLALGNPQSS